MPTVMAYAADITSSEDRGKGMGVVARRPDWGLYSVLPSENLFKISLSMPFLVAGVSSFITFFLRIFLKESLSKQRPHANGTILKEAVAGPHFILLLLQLFVSISMAGLKRLSLILELKKQPSTP